MNFISVICLLLLYLQIKPPETENVNKTDVSLSYFKEKLKWIREMNEILIIFHFGPNPIKTYQSRSNLDQIKNNIKILSIWPILNKQNS